MLRPIRAAPECSGATPPVWIAPVPRIGTVDRDVGLDARGPVAEHDDAIGQEHRLLHIMGHHQRGETALLPKRGDFRLHGDARQGIELAERLVEDEDFGIVDQRPRQRDPLRHAAGKLMRIGVAKCRKPDQIDRRIDAVALALQDALGFEAERDIVPDGSPRKQGRILEHHHTRRKRPRDQIAVFAQRARPRRLQSCDQPQQGRFPATGRTEQSDEFAGLNVEADIVQHRQHGAIDVEAMADVLDIQRSAGCGRCNALSNRQRYHLTTPFCQTSSRSRVRNSNVIAPEHNSDITISAAYIFA